MLFYGKDVNQGPSSEAAATEPIEYLITDPTIIKTQKEYISASLR